MNQIVAFCGKKRCGKDTAADVLEKHFNIERCALAQPIKDLIVKNSNSLITMDMMNGVDYDREQFIGISAIDVRDIIIGALGDLYEEGRLEFNVSTSFKTGKAIGSIKAKDWTVRKMMQVLGTDIVCNIFGNNIWLDIAQDKYNQSTADIFLITDCRQPWEYKHFKERGATFIHIEKIGGKEAKKDEHSSENGLTPQEGDVTIQNIHNQLEQFELNLIKVIKDLK